MKRDLHDRHAFYISESIAIHNPMGAFIVRRRVHGTDDFSIYAMEKRQRMVSDHALEGKNYILSTADNAAPFT